MFWAKPVGNPTPISPNHQFNTGAVNITSTSAYQLVGLITGCRGRRVVVEVLVGAGGALAHLALSRAAVPGGNHQSIAIDTDFNTATADLRDVVNGSATPNVYQTAAGGNFQFSLDAVADEYALWAQVASTATTVQMVGTAYRVGQ